MNITHRLEATLIEEAILTEQLVINKFKRAVEEFKIIYAVACEELPGEVNKWLSLKDGNLIHITAFQNSIRMTQHTTQEHDSFNFAQSAIGQHFVLEINDDATIVTGIESYNTSDMQTRGQVSGYTSGEHFHSVSLKDNKSIRDGIDKNFPINDFIALVDSIGAPSTN